MVASLPALPIVGGVVSTTVMVCVLVAEWLPQASVASHVLVSVKVLPQLPVVTSESRCTVAPLQASDAVGWVKEGVAVHSMVASLPALPMVGGVVSTTVDRKSVVGGWLRHASVASHGVVC